MVLVFGSCAWRYAKTGKTPNPDKALQLAALLSGLKPVAAITGAKVQNN